MIRKVFEQKQEMISRWGISDDKSDIAKQFWEDVSEIMIDPFNNVRAIQLPKSNKVYKPMSVKSYKSHGLKENKFAYATWRNVDPLFWMEIQDKYRSQKDLDYLGEYGDVVSV